MNKLNQQNAVNGATKTAEQPRQPQSPKSAPIAAKPEPAAQGVHKVTPKSAVKPQIQAKDVNASSRAARGDDDVMSQGRKPS